MLALISLISFSIALTFAALEKSKYFLYSASVSVSQMVPATPHYGSMILVMILAGTAVGTFGAVPVG